MQKYEEIGVAGEGAYGVVLKCRHKDSGEVVAVKRFHEPEDADEEGKRIMQREIKILKALKHENIVQVRDCFRQKGVLHIVFEYLEKCVLELLDANPNGLGNNRARTLTCQLVSALDHCHRNSIIHRDIKPDNLLVNLADNSLRLCDFGSACILVGPVSSRGDAELTDYVATRWYRAPELLVSFNNYDASVDMWSMGCVTVELLTSRPLFAGQTDLDQLSIIQGCLGPLTAQQNARCFELSNPDFAKLKVPALSERQTLQQRFQSSMAPDHLQLLESVIRADPTQRATAKTALGMAWLRGAQLPKKPLPASPRAHSNRPTSQQSSARPPSVQKPRVRKDASPYGLSSASAKTTPRGGGPCTTSTNSGRSTAVGIVSDAMEVEESMSFAAPGCSHNHHHAASVDSFMPEEIAEDSIAEEIFDGTAPGPPPFASEHEEACEPEVPPPGGVPLMSASTGSRGVGIALGAPPSNSPPIPSQQPVAAAVPVPVQQQQLKRQPSPGASKLGSLAAAAPSTPREALQSVASVTDFSISPDMHHASCSRYTDPCEDSILEEIGDDAPMPLSVPNSARQSVASYGASAGFNMRNSRATSPCSSSVSVTGPSRLVGGSSSKCSSLVRRPTSGKPPTSSLTPMA